jgi:hypothetical protein
MSKRRATAPPWRLPDMSASGLSWRCYGTLGCMVDILHSSGGTVKLKTLRELFGLSLFT